jgi:L-ribulose-5-phosphate 3-epimerase
MTRMKIGIRLESLGLPLRKALGEVAGLGVPGVQFDAVGDLAPRALTQTGRRELRNLLRAHDLELTAVGCPLRRGLDAAEDQQARIEHVQNVLALSADLGPRRVIVQAGQVPAEDEADAPRARTLRESLTALAQHGDRVGAVLALETGLESGEVLAAYLRSFDTGSLAANLDPANLLMNGFNPAESARALCDLIAHAHAKDARRASASRAAQEVALGHGDLDWLGFLGVLAEVEYAGWLVIERETGDNRRGDVAEGVSFLRRVIP